VYGIKNPIQRYRNHKIRNVLGYLVDEQKDQAKCAMKAAFSLGADKDQQKLKQLAKWLEREYPSAASSLLERLDEIFTMNCLGLPKTLCLCFGSQNVIESQNIGVRGRTGRLKNWRDHRMVACWVVVLLLDMEQRFKRVIDYQRL
jgi:transposase-like protein